MSTAGLIQFYRRYVYRASDGVAIRDNNNMVRFSRRLWDTINFFEAHLTLPGVADGGNALTIEEQQAYLKNGRAHDGRSSGR